jgi:hypothetical protein
MDWLISSLVQDLTRTANVNATSAENTADNRQPDNESTEPKQQPAINSTQSTLTLGNLGLLEENLSHGIDHWIREEKKDGGVRFYRE